MDTINCPRVGKGPKRTLQHVPATNRVATTVHVRSAFTKAGKVLGVDPHVIADVFLDGYQAFINDARTDHGTEGLHALVHHPVSLRTGVRVVGYKDFFVTVLGSTNDPTILVAAVKCVLYTESVFLGNEYRKGKGPEKIVALMLDGFLREYVE